jgi:hypothetical protein
MFFEDRKQFGEIYFDPLAAFGAHTRRNALKLAESGAEGIKALIPAARIGDIRHLNVILMGHSDLAVTLGLLLTSSDGSARVRHECFAVGADSATIRAASSPASSRASRSARNRLVLASLAADSAATSCLAVVHRCSRAANSISAFRRATSLFCLREITEFSMAYTSYCAVLGRSLARGLIPDTHVWDRLQHASGGISGSISSTIFQTALLATAIVKRSPRSPTQPDRRVNPFMDPSDRFIGASEPQCKGCRLIQKNEGHPLCRQQVTSANPG